MTEFEHLPIKDRLILWLLLGETGVSSETIAYALSGIKPETTVLADGTLTRRPHRWDIPHDAADFRRCLLLLEYIPEWRERLPEVAERFPAWKPIVEHWDELEYIYENGNNAHFYARLRKLQGTK